MRNDNWGTPPWLFNSLNSEFKFNLDACADETNYKCAHYYDIHRNCLITEWKPLLRDAELRAFMNPPYSNPKPFIEKAWEMRKNGLVVCLVKVDTSTKWWNIFWDYEKHSPKNGCEVRFLPKRIKFIPPKGKDGTSGPTFPSAIIVMRRSLC